MRVSVAYVGAEDVLHRVLEARAGTRVKEAIEQSGMLSRFPEIDLDLNKVGIFGKLVKLDQPLAEGDRIEIYRPLIADPKASRQRRADAIQSPAN
nr:RnfH family protein [Thiocystis violacea]